MWHYQQCHPIETPFMARTRPSAITRALLIAATPLLAVTTLAAAAADMLYFNGTIITMDDQRPLADAVAVRDGRILAVGTEQEVLAGIGETTRRMDLQGRTLLPGFVDSHGHAYGIGLQAISANLLPPPDGDGADIRALQAQL